MKLLKNKNIKYVAFIIIAVIVIVSTAFFNLFTKKENAVETYIDGVHSDNLPAKDSGYIVEKVVCDNDKNPTWNNDNWMIEHSEHWQKESCSVYFKKLESFTLADRTFYLDEMQKCPSINSDGTVTVEGAEETDGYLCRAKDAYGDSYYYRGNVTNNYVKFAGYYWRIIRYNGDGTVRVIYDGTSAHSNSDISTDRQIGATTFNNYWKQDDILVNTNSFVHYDNAGIGYMYGNRDDIVEYSSQYLPSTYKNTNTYYIAKEYNYDFSTDRFTLKEPIAILGSDMSIDYVGYYTYNSDISNESNQYIYKITSVASKLSGMTVNYSYVTYGTTSKKKAQTNTNSSDIKAYIDTWYENNIKGTANERYVADNIFCNDRSFALNNVGTGSGTTNTYYRWSSFANNSNNNKMMLMCPQQNDAFTVDDTIKGNGALTYGVGVITTDEVVLAGGWSSSNSNYYLYTGHNYWTISPSLFGGKYASEHFVSYDGKAFGTGFIEDENDVRPVLNLSSDILKKGSGTAEDPFHLSEN